MDLFVIRHASAAPRSLMTVGSPDLLIVPASSSFR